MKRVLFSSLDGGQSHRQLILSELYQAHFLVRSTKDPVDLQIMSFAFTDTEIAREIASLADSYDNLRVQVIADWSQGAPNSPSVVPGLSDQQHIDVKYKLDLPYFADKATGRVQWGYRSSHGMLHHKTMLIRMNGLAERMILGSFNWGMRGSQSYENTMLLTRDEETGTVLDAFAAEFDALWNDPAITAEPDDVAELAIIARQKVQVGGSLHNLDDLHEVLGARAVAKDAAIKSSLTDGAILPAFSGRHLTSLKAHYGFAAHNHARKLNLLRPSGARKPAPLSVNAVALEAIRATPDGAPLKFAMYAMSPRVPEFEAMLTAARRGCPVSVLLDNKIGKGFAAGLTAKANNEGLPIDVRTTNRRMHQKYLVSPDTGTVVTGTANMTRDSADRHAEHRILFRNDAMLATQFEKDFNTIWGRLA